MKRPPISIFNQIIITSLFVLIYNGTPIITNIVDHIAHPFF